MSAAASCPVAAGAAEFALSLCGVCKSFGPVRVLDDISLDVRRGEFLSLLGPSGCGKTTLLRIIGGFETPDTGRVQIGGGDAADQPPYRRRTNTIFQHLALFPHLTVAQNIAFGLEMKRLPRPVIRARVAEALALVRLAEFGDRRIAALSGGQKQRIALARALVNDPEILLLDEPLGALDLQLRLQMQEELRALHRQTGRTFIFVTHDQSEAITMSDRLAVMQAGRILQVGTPREVYERPNHRFVAAFMGQSNFLDGTVEQGGPDGRVRVGRHALPCRLPDDFLPGRQVTLTVRYERIMVRPAAEGGALPGRVVAQTYLGATMRLDIRLDDGITLTAELIARDAADLGIGAGVAIGWTCDTAAILTS